MQVTFAFKFHLQVCQIRWRVKFSRNFNDLCYCIVMNVITTEHKQVLKVYVLIDSDISHFLFNFDLRLFSDQL